MSDLATARRRIEQMEHDYNWPREISDPDTWGESEMSAAAAVLAGVYAALDEVEPGLTWEAYDRGVSDGITFERNQGPEPVRT